MQIRGSQGYNNASLQHYLDIIVGDIKGDIGSNSGWGGGDLGVEEEEMFLFFASIVSNQTS